MKKMSLVMLSMLLLIVAFLSACGTNANNNNGTNESVTSKPTTEAQEELEPITLRVAWWGSQQRHDATLAAMEIFKEKHPNVTFETEFAGWDGYWQKLATQSAANGLPDVIQHDYGMIGQYASKGLLTDLNEFTSNQTINLSDVSESTISSGTIDGKLYGIPLGINSLGVVYDPAIFADAGIAEPTGEWTWDEFTNVARDMKEATGVYGANMLPIDFTTWLIQHDQSLFNAEGTGVGFEDPALASSFWQYYLDLMDEGLIPRMDETLAVSGLEDELIVHGKAGMTALWSNAIVALTNAADRPLNVALLPSDSDNSGLYIKPSMFFSIPSSSKNKEMAAKFIDFITNDIDANHAMMAERGVPISSKIREALAPNLTEGQQVMFEYLDVAEQHAEPIPAIGPAGSAEVTKLISTLTEQVLYKQITPEQAAENLMKQVGSILENNK